MNNYIHKTKREKIDWLYWFYDGRYTKAKIKQKDYENWYYRLRYIGAVKPVRPYRLIAKKSSINGKEIPRHIKAVAV